MSDITHTLTTSFLRDAINGTQFDFSSGTSDVYKCALYTSSASLDYSTTAYSATNEASGAGYSAGGETLTISTNPTIDVRTVYWTFADVTWASSSITARYALIYKADGGSNPSVAVIDLGAEWTSSSSDFVVQMPARLLNLVAGV
jgi:hypothetical protein